MAELEQPNIVGNYLSNYYAAQQKQQAEQDRQRNMQRQDRQDDMAEQQFSGQMDLQKLETAVKRGQAMTQIICRVRDGDAQGFEAAKAQAVQELGLPPDQVAHLTIADLPRLRAESGQTMRELEIAYKRAQIGSEQAQGRAADALANQRRLLGGQAGAGGGKYGGGKPLTERESKDLGWAIRGERANSGFTDDRIAELINSRNVVGRKVPLVGNKLQSDKSRQAVQIAKDFVAVVLRKDTGAAVTPKEFDFYEDIFIPAWGDDPGTLQIKAGARKTFLDALKMGLGPRAALQQLGVTPPEGLAPPEDDKTSVIENPSMGGWSATVEE